MVPRQRGGGGCQGGASATVASVETPCSTVQPSLSSTAAAASTVFTKVETVSNAAVEGSNSTTAAAADPTSIEEKCFDKDATEPDDDFQETSLNGFDRMMEEVCNILPHFLCLNCHVSLVVLGVPHIDVRRRELCAMLLNLAPCLMRKGGHKQLHWPCSSHKCLI